MELTLSDPQSGFFLRPPKRSDDAALNNKREFAFVPVQHPALLTLVTAQRGEFVASDRVTIALLKRAIDSERLFPSLVIDDLEISAHVVTKTITSDRPMLQVLFHANVIQAKTDIKHSNSAVRNASNSGGGFTHRSETKYCLTAHVHRDMNRASGICVLNARTSACLAEPVLPLWWWNSERPENAYVFFSAMALDQTRDCEMVRNETLGDDVQFVMTVNLVQGQVTYEEIREDKHQNILVYIPQASFYPGSKFRVPVKLQAQSDLQIFVMK